MHFYNIAQTLMLSQNIIKCLPAIIKYSEILMKMLQNKSTIDGVINQLFSTKKSDYSQFILNNFVEMLGFDHRINKVLNKKKQKLHTSIFTKNGQTKPEICIIYLHGYGSNRLQCLNILKVLNSKIALCCFDFSGSGKSQGSIITYGAKQKEDIASVVSYLKQKGFKKFVLWGRSMGATSSLLYTLKYKPKQVFLQIIDSPFYSFEYVAKQLVDKYLKIPNFGINFLIDLVKDHCKSFQNNPFSVQLSKIGYSITPTIFIYSENDDIVSFKNSQKICSLYNASFQKLVIQQNHNSLRSLDTLQSIMKSIQKYYIKSKKQQLNHKTSRNSNSNSSNKSIRRGINRAPIEATDTSNPKMVHADYGIWMSSRSFISKQLGNKQKSIYSQRLKAQTPNVHFISSQKQDQNNFRVKNNCNDYNLNSFVPQKQQQLKRKNYLYRSMDNKSFSSAKTNSSIRSSMMLSYKHYL